MTNLKSSLIKGSFWAVTGVVITLVINFLINIFLTRALSPDEFGKFGIVLFFITMSSVFVDGGMTGALIRKNNPTQEDFSTVFIFNFLISIFCALLLILFSSYVADYYHIYEIKILLIVSSLIILIQSFQFTQNAKLMCEMKFKERSIYRLIATIISGTVSIIFAYQSFGVWALVLQQIFYALVLTLILVYKQGFYFSWHFNKTSFKELYGFGINTTMSSLLTTGFDNVYQLVIGKVFSITQVGFFLQAKKLQDVPGGIVNMLSQSVIFSTLSKLQDDLPAFLTFYKKIVVLFLTFLGLASVLLYLFSDSIIFLLYGKKWEGAVFFMQTLTFSSFFYYQELLNRIIFKVFNKTKIILYLEILKKIFQLVSIVLGVYFHSLPILVFGLIINNALSYFANYYLSRKIVDGFDYSEIISFIKVIAIVVTTILLFEFVFRYFTVAYYIKFLFFPFVLFLYLIQAHAIGIIHIFKIIESVKKNIKL